MMGTPLYHIIASLGTIFFSKLPIWATRPKHLTFASREAETLKAES
jgi:hypothetical protein